MTFASKKDLYKLLMTDLYKQERCCGAKNMFDHKDNCYVKKLIEAVQKQGDIFIK